VSVVTPVLKKKGPVSVPRCHGELRWCILVLGIDQPVFQYAAEQEKEKTSLWETPVNYFILFYFIFIFIYFIYNCF
jgi:hypothetical protein